jgi:hypothetical protein
MPYPHRSFPVPGTTRSLFLKSIAHAILIFLVSHSLASGKIIYVNNSSDSPVHDGNSWKTAFSDLKTGLIMAADGDQIWVAAGTYKPTLGTSRDATFLMVKDIEIYGGFAGNETYLSGRDFSKQATILSGDLNGDDFKFTHNEENCFHVISVFGNAKVVLDGINIRGGNANNDLSLEDSFGGGILLYGQASLTMKNCCLTWNYGKLGGAIYSNKNNQLSIYNSTFKANSATYGGAICNLSQQPCLIQESVFSGNTGIALVNLAADSATQHLRHCTITGNAGGSIHFSDQCLPTLEHTIICRNGGPGTITGPRGEVINCEIENGESDNTSYFGIFVLQVTPEEAPSAEGDFHFTAKMKNQQVGALYSAVPVKQKEQVKPVLSRTEIVEIVEPPGPKALPSLAAEKKPLEIQDISGHDPPTPVKQKREAVKDIEPEFNPFNMYVYPNPFSGKLSLNFNEDLAEKANIKLLDNHGKTILSREVEATSGKYQLAVATDLPSGPYQVVLTYQEQTYIQVVNKW